MIKAFSSLYRPKYLRALVYMLQESEYSIKEYLQWFGRTNDFSQVEKRKQLVMTTKARLLLAVLWLEVLTIGFVIFQALIANLPLNDRLIVAFSLVLIAPLALAYSLIIPLLLGQVLIQGPQERRLNKITRSKLAAHPAVKIAIAGSFGKTTFKETLATVLREGKKVSATPGNMNTPIGISRFVDRLQGDEEILIFELGEYYPGDIRKLCDLVQPDIGIITGVNEAHLMRFKTLERTTGTIFELADYLGKKPVYVNGESELANAAAQPNHLVFDRAGVGEWKVSQAKTGLDGTEFIATKGNLKVKAKSGLLSLRRIGTLVATIDIAERLGLKPQQIEAGIAKTTSYEHRMEPKPSSDGVVTIDDSYNGNPDSARAAIEFLAGLKGHRRFYVTPGLVEVGPRTTEVHQEIGRQLAASGIEKVILMRNSATPFIAEGLKENNFQGELIWFDDPLKGLAALSSLTVSGDVVLIQNDWSDNYA